MAHTTLGTMREFHTKNFLVRCTAEEEYDIDLSWDDTGETARKLDSGEWITFCAVVKVYYKGEEVGSDYLSNCIYPSIEKFMDHQECGKQNRKWAKQGKQNRCGSYFHDMIREACEEARKTIKLRKQDYQQIFVRYPPERMTP